jgi:hypothetical protein
MDTNSLIHVLTSDARLPARRIWLPLAIAAGLALAYSALAIIAVAGPRTGFEDHIDWVAFKAGVSLLFAAFALPWTLRLARPEATLGAWPFLVLGLFAGIALVAIFAATTMTNPTWATLSGGGFPHCIIVIPVVAIPSGALFFLWLSQQAPTRPALAGAAAGLGAGALAAASYALTCPVDSVAFIALWYPAAIAICAMLAAGAGKFLLRW